MKTLNRAASGGGGGTAGCKVITVVLWCNEPALVAGIEETLAAAPDVRLVSAFSEFSDFLDCLERTGANIALVDAPPRLGLSSILEISRRAPGSRIVLWVHSINLQLAHHLKEAGVAGILRRQLSAELTLRCLRKVADGEIWFDRELMNSLLQTQVIRLSPRERQLVELVSRGYSNKQIAYSLSISEGSVKVYFSRLFRKVGVRDRFELALFGLQNRYLDDMPAVQQRLPLAVARESVPDPTERYGD